MKVVALISGGKDSCFNIMQCIAEGHQIVALANLYPSEQLESEELDSYMFQSVGYKGIESYAKAMQLPLYRQEILGKSLYVEKNYLPTMSDEVEDLYSLITTVKHEHPDLQGVSSGAILSDYQRSRVENVCDRLNLVSLAYLWHRNQADLLSEMIRCGVDAIIIKVASYGLTKKYLNARLQDLQPQLLSIANKFELNVCGEGGEYETFTLDTPLFSHQINITDSCVVELSAEDTLSPVAYLAIKNVELIEKDTSTVKRLATELSTLPMLTKQNSLIDLYSNVKSEIQLNIETSPINLDDSEISTNFQFNVIGPILTEIDWSIGEDSIYQSTLKSLQILKQKIEEVSSFENLIYSLVCVREMSWFAEVNRAYSEVFPHFHPPPRACIGVPQYVLSKNELEVKPDVSFSCLLHSSESAVSSHLHVKSLSHWAPANIGPYSQALQLTLSSSSRLFVSGQIGMHPEDLSLTATVADQMYLSLRHVERVAKATSNFNLVNNLDFGICYASSNDTLSLSRQIFHDIICALLSESSDSPITCLCDRIIWVCVCQLPKSAAVELQIVLKSQNVRSAVISAYKNGSSSPLLTIFKASKTEKHLSDSIIIPVESFINANESVCYIDL